MTLHLPCFATNRLRGSLEPAHRPAPIHEPLASQPRRYLPGLLLFFLALSATAQDEPSLFPPDELKKLSLQTLLDIDVTTVSKKVEKLSRAASAIQVITGEEIRRSGASSIPEALRLATNLEVAQVDARQWAITARGFNSTTANKLLVLIDGRKVYTPLYSGVFWDVQDVVLDDIDRIEVISGPGGTLWGDNAVNGVINIVTKLARDTQGTTISVRHGTEASIVDGIRFGSRTERSDYRVYGKFAIRDASSLTSGADAGDDTELAQGGFRLDTRLSDDTTLTVQGDAYRGTFEQLVPDDIDVEGANLLTRWERRLSERSTIGLQAYYDRTERTIPTLFSETLETWDLELEHRFTSGDRHDLIWGVNVREEDDAVRNSDVLAFLPADLATHRWSAFVQDEISLRGGRLRLAIGTKLGHNDFSGFEYQPSVRLAAQPSANRTIWAAVSRAVRSPSRIDRDFFVPQLNLAGGPGFESETLIAYELGVRQTSGERVQFSSAAFFHDYDDLRSLENSSPRVLANGLNGEAYGIELEGTGVVASWWRLTGGYTFLDLELHTKPGSTDTTSTAQEGDSPEHRFQLRSSMDLGERIQWDSVARYVSSLPNQAIPAYWELDMRVGWVARDGVDISIIGRNLLHAKHAEFGAPGRRRELERSIAARVSWRF